MITHIKQRISLHRQLHFSLSEINEGENSQDVGDLREYNSTVLVYLPNYSSLFNCDLISANILITYLNLSAVANTRSNFMI